MLYGSKPCRLHGCLKFVSDLLPAIDGLQLGSDARRWDGSKLLNLPKSKAVVGLGLVVLNCAELPYERQYSPLAPGNSVTSNNTYAFGTPVVAGCLTKMKVRVTDMNDFGIDVPIYVRKNGVNTSATVTVAAGAMNTTYTWTGSVSVAENDLLDLYYDITGASGWEVARLTLSFEFQPA